MRTTLTIPDDIYAEVVNLAKASDKRVSEVVSDLLRQKVGPKSYDDDAGEPPVKSPFVTFPYTGKISMTSETVRQALEEEDF
jgi:hypothetical protein